MNVWMLTVCVCICADDCLYVLRGSPSLDLLWAFTQPYQDQQATLSVGFVCHTFLRSDQEDLALQLLENICSAGAGTVHNTANLYTHTYPHGTQTCI